MYVVQKSRFEENALEEILPDGPEGELLTLMACKNRTSLLPTIYEIKFNKIVLTG